MSAFSVTTGLISGLNTSDIVDALIAVQRNGAARMESRAKVFQGRQAALSVLQASLLPILTASRQLQTSTTFRNMKVTISDSSQLTVSAGTTSSPGDFAFRTVRTAQTHEVISAGASNAESQTFGTGQLVISTAGGELRRATSLNLLNGGDGVRRGSIRITDRSGASAVIDLNSAVSVDEVLAAINDNETISVTATTEGGRIVLTDATGSTSSNLIVAEIGTGRTAADLGIAGSVASSRLTGSDVLQVTGDFGLKQINDGNGPRLVSGADIRITLSDDSEFEVDLDGVATINDVLKKINEHDDNGGKVLASFSNGRIVLTDQSGGGGTADFAIENLGGASIVRELGLDTAESGGAITGRRVVAGINSVLLSNLRGGKGIDSLGEISLTDRAGNTATIDLSGAESLDEVLTAINAAETAGSVKLQITAKLNAQGTGIEIVDTSGSTASNLIIADLGGSTLAEQLGIAVDAAQTTVDSGSLNLRHVNEGTSLSNYRLNGGAVRAGSFRITDSSGNSAVISIGGAEKNIGDVLKKINNATGISVTARLNDTGDGIVLIDDANGSDDMTVVDVSGSAGTDLRLVGTGKPNGNGDSQINARRAIIVDVEADDTLNEIRNKINLLGGFAAASVISTGNPIKPVRLLIRSNQSGAAGRLIVDDGALDLGFNQRVEGKDAVLQVGQDVATSTFLTSSSNTFSNVNAGVNVTVVSASDKTANVSIARDDSNVETILQSFVSSYNTYLQAYRDSTKFDFAAGQRGVLQGQGFAFRLQSRMETLLSSRYAPDTSSVRTLQDVGITIGTDGKLSIDSEKLNTALADHRTDVVDFFQKASTGFAVKLTATVDSMTNTVDGSFKSENDSLQRTIDAITTRVAEIDKVLAVRRVRLLRQFTKMEESLSLMQSSQSALAGLQNQFAPSK